MPKPNIDYPMKKHLLVTIEERQGDCAHLSDTLVTVDAHVPPEHAGDLVAKNWYEEDGVKNERGQWEFHDGGNIVSANKVVKVPPKDYQVLKRYFGEVEIQIQPNHANN